MRGTGRRTEDAGRLRRQRRNPSPGRRLRADSTSPSGRVGARQLQKRSHIRNTPNRVPSTGALSVAENASASTRLVSLGRIIPSSHSLAVA
jgi:hypothetical protein